MSYSNNTKQNNSSSSFFGIIGLIAIIVLIIFVARACIQTSNEMSQYEKDYYSSRNKTWGELTDGEKEVVKDEIEWLVKQNGGN